MENIGDRFETSARQWGDVREREERASPLPNGTLDAQAADRFSSSEMDTLAAAGVRFLSSQAITRHQIEVWQLRQSCQSAIELPFALALIVIARHEGIPVRLVFGSTEGGDLSSPGCRKVGGVRLALRAAGAARRPSRRFP